MCDEGIFLREIECKHCHNPFFICQSCYRGHVYCSDACRTESQAEAHRKSQSKYRTSNKGREANSEGAKRRRMGKNQKNEKSVADDSFISPSPVLPYYPTFPNMRPRCRFCGSYGVIVDFSYRFNHSIIDKDKDMVQKE